MFFGGLPLAAQLPGSASLKGAYYVRYMGLYTDTYSDIGEDPSGMCLFMPCRMGFQGVLAFDGNGRYQLAGRGIAPNQTSGQGSGQGALTAAATGRYQALSRSIPRMAPRPWPPFPWGNQDADASPALRVERDGGKSSGEFRK